MTKKIFHQVVRYIYAQWAINGLRTQKSHKILEVGSGAHANLAKYLPDDSITFLDIDLPKEVLKDPRFVTGDATNLVYEDGEFDFIVALDVIEHIPVEKRASFIENVNRVAKVGVILSAPHYSAKSPHEDELLKSFYVLCDTEPPVWIDEHVDCTLPSQEEIIKLINAQGITKDKILSFYGVKRELMLKMLIMEAVSSKFDKCLNFFDIVNSDYIDSILCQDNGLQKDQAMKTYILWEKEGNLGKFRKKIESEKEDAKKDIDNFEKKYSDLMEWVLGISNLFYAVQLTQFQEKSNEMIARIEDMQNTIQGDEKVILERINEISSDQLKLNVILITYNQSKFIRETLETILMQQTTFKFNIIIADDCSSDDTVSIIREMEKQTEIPFVYLDNDHNLGVMQNYKRAFSACHAEYVAIMEGDDLWTDKLRLQKHIDFLDNHCECAMSFNRYVVKNFEEDSIITQPGLGENAQYFSYISGHDLAYNNLIGNFSTCVYRTSALKSLPDSMYSMKCYDWLTNIMVSKMGYIGYLTQTMSIYRVHSGGTWSGQSEKERIDSIIEVIDAYDKYTNYEFTAGFAAHKARLWTMRAASVVKAEKMNKVSVFIKSILRKCYRISAYLPPIFICVIKLMVPSVIQEKIRNK